MLHRFKKTERPGNENLGKLVLAMMWFSKSAKKKK